MQSIAALPMYDWPETRAETDVQWDGLREALRAAGVDAPERLARTNADLPPVAGGVRDGKGRAIAADPASLPPDQLDVHAVWLHPKLLLAQTCWGPMEQGLGAHVTVVGQPSYDGMEGGQGAHYSSVILMRVSEGSAVGQRRTGDIPAPADGRPLIPLELIRGKRLAYNGLDSMSGVIALTRDLEAAGETSGIFDGRLETGSHRASIVAVAEGRADFCAIDCKSWQLARLHEPRAADVRVVGWTARRLGLPLITSKHTPPEIVAILRDILGRPGSAGPYRRSPDQAEISRASSG